MSTKQLAIAVKTLLIGHYCDIYERIHGNIKFDEHGNDLFRIGRLSRRQNGSYVIKLFSKDICEPYDTEPGLMSDAIEYLNTILTDFKTVSVERDTECNFGIDQWNVRVIVR